jgi:NAD(P)-dependent dehydrogenase (short-subunit alcohol dehydrogenase family)
MSAHEAAKTLRAGLLRGVSLLLACAPSDARGSANRDAVRLAFSELGARVRELEVLADGASKHEDAIEQGVRETLAGDAGIDMLVVDGAGVFTGAGAGRAGLRICLEATWSVTRALANAAFIPAGRGGRIAYLAPAPGAGPHARACCAGLENLARTLSIEWARHGITPVAIAPGDDTDAGELAAIAAYLASPAGAYFSGCLLDLTAPGPRR